MSEEGDIERALEIFQEFGPDRAIPVQNRWRAAFPNTTTEELQEWEALFRELERFAYKLGEQVWNGEISSSEAAATLSKRFPLLGPERIDHTVSQAIYFASK